MAKSSTATSAQQIPENPTVLIRYEPANAPLVLADNATKMLARINSAKPITTVKQLETVSEIISDANITAGEIETFVDTLRSKVQEAASRFKELRGFEDFEVTLTIRNWSLRQLVTSGISKLKQGRAKYLSDEQERVRREQLEAQAKQDKINKEAAAKAAASAKNQGADKQTINEIKNAVMETPAPIVTSPAVDTAKDMGASVRYTYSAEIVSLKSFLESCITNPVLLNTLTKAIPDIEKAFGGMARDQKELFQFPGIRVKKTPVDVGRRS